MPPHVRRADSMSSLLCVEKLRKNTKKNNKTPNILKSWYPKNTFNYSIMSLDSSFNALIDCWNVSFLFLFRFCSLFVFAAAGALHLRISVGWFVYFFVWLDLTIKCMFDERAIERSTKKANSNFVTSINRNCFTIETIHELLSITGQCYSQLLKMHSFRDAISQFYKTSTMAVVLECAVFERQPCSCPSVIWHLADVWTVQYDF